METVRGDLKTYGIKTTYCRVVFSSVTLYLALDKTLTLSVCHFQTWLTTEAHTNNITIPFFDR